MLLLAASVEAGRDGLESAGRRIYRNGVNGEGRAVTADLVMTGTRLSGVGVACRNCHGDGGEGSAESGLTAPALTWARLAQPRPAPIPARPAYGDAELRRALAEGKDPAGRLLHPAMPRYRLDRRDADGLLAYLRILGTELDTDPGVDPDVIRVGTALPLTGERAATGRLVQDTLTACVARVNGDGGVFGRRLELRVFDSASGRAGQVQPEVFAWLARFESDAAPAAIPEPEAGRIPSIGPLADMTMAPEQSGASTFALLPTLADQAAALVRFAAAENAARTGSLRLGLIRTPDRQGEVLAAAVLEQVRRLELPDPVVATAETALAPALSSPDFKAVNAMVVLGGAREWSAVSAAWPDSGPLLLGLLTTSGRAVLALPPPIAARVRLAVPFAVDDAAGIDALSAELRAEGMALSNPGLQAAACGAVQVFAEAARRSGRRLTRARLVDALESLQDFHSPLLPAIGFAKGGRNGSAGAYVVAVGQGGFQARSGWVESPR